MTADGKELDSHRASGARELLAVLVGVTLLAVLLTFPLAFQMTHVGRIDNFDGDLSIWNVAWVARTLIANPTHVLDANIYYPHRGTLAYSETNLGAGALAIPAYWATRNPYFALNVVFLLSLALSAAGGYYLVRYLVGDRRAAVVAAICFGFCPYVFGRTPHIQLLMTAGLPFSMLAFHRLVDRPRAGRASVLGLVMAVQTVFCGYYAIFVMLMVGFGALTVAALRGWWTNLRYWKAMALAAVLATVAAAPMVTLYLRLQRVDGFRRELSDAVRYSADWQSYLASNAVGHQWLLPFLGHWNEVLFPGFVAMVGGAAGVLVGWRRGGQLREAVILYGALTLLACWASFGPEAGLYTFLYRLIPGFTLMRAPARFGILVALGLAVLTGVAVREALARVAHPVLVSLGLALVTSAELVTPLHFPEVPPVLPAYTLLSTLPAGPVIELPFYENSANRFAHAMYMLNSTAHWMPLINGYSDYIPPDFTIAALTLRFFPRRDAFGLLAGQRPRYALFHLNLYGDEAHAATTIRLREFAPYLTPLYADTDTRLYEIVEWPR